jgi:hypothetical protein
MTTRPTDITDLYLAPVALRLDRQLAALSQLTEERVHVWVAVVTDREPATVDERRALTLRALRHEVDTHHWRLEHDPRGIRLSHGDHSLVLGIPESLRSYLGS